MKDKCKFTVNSKHGQSANIWKIEVNFEANRYIFYSKNLSLQQGRRLRTFVTHHNLRGRDDLSPKDIPDPLSGETRQYVDLTFAVHHDCTPAI